MKDHIKKELEKKGHSHPDLAAPLMAGQIDQMGGFETANLAKLQRIIDDVHSIMIEFGSNSYEHARMADAENALYDAKETIQEKDLKGEYVQWEKTLGQDVIRALSNQVSSLIEGAQENVTYDPGLASDMNEVIKAGEEAKRVLMGVADYSTIKRAIDKFITITWDKSEMAGGSPDDFISSYTSIFGQNFDFVK